jgi:hypothetical protein
VPFPSALAISAEIVVAIIGVIARRLRLPGTSDQVREIVQVDERVCLTAKLVPKPLAVVT